MIPGNAEPLLLTSASSYQIERSLRFNSADSAYLSRTPASAGNRKTWTWSGWIKRSKVGVGISQSIFGATPDNYVNNYTWLRFSVDNLYINHTDGSGGARYTTALYRDPSAWMHVVVALDTTQAVAADRLKLYVNGVIPPYTGADPGLNEDWWINAANPHYLNAIATVGATYGQQLGDHYLADVFFIDGQALTPSSFGETNATTGQWVPKAYSGTFTGNSFWLKFADNSAATATTLGKDSLGLGNNWTPNNLSVTAGVGNDSLVDTPTSYGTDTGAGGEVRGNYATLNPLRSTGSLSNGALDYTSTLSTSVVASTYAVSSGKWYWEVVPTSGVDNMLGILQSTITIGGSYPLETTGGYGYYQPNGSKYPGNIAYSSSYGLGDVIGFALDMNAGSLVIYKNGVSQGTFVTGLTGFWSPAAGQGASSGTNTGTFNFGQRPFAYTAPSGFKALCDTNLPTPTIAKPSTVMDTVLYTGTGATLTPTSSLGFSPDLVWIKSRSAATDNTLYDTVRGAQARVESNTSSAEVTGDNGLTAFNSNGFTLGTLAQVNTNNDTYAAWCWDGGSSTVTNTNGTISSQVRANANAGFSVVTYTGTGSNASVGHGLNVAPQFIVINARVGRNWNIYHVALGATKYIQFSVAAAVTLNTLWNDEFPTSTVFKLGTSIGVNGSTEAHVAYCFAPVAGYSSFGSYTGNGNASNDGPFVYTGFRPRWIMIKSTSSGNWTIFDALRVGYNVDNEVVYPNLTNGSSVDNDRRIDILSNGFKIRNTTFGSTDINSTTATTFVYAAFAENPFQYARAR